MRILALTWPTNGKGELMINARRDLLCPAIDGIVDELLQRGHSVICVNLAAEVRDYHAEELSVPGFVSGVPFFRWSEVKNREFDLVWHAIKDPTPAAAVEVVERAMRQLNPDVRVLNPVSKLKDHVKRNYLPVLVSKGVGVPILEPYAGIEDAQGIFDPAKCHPSHNGAHVSHDLGAVRVAQKNCDRFSLRLPEEGVTLKYLNNAGRREAGMRTFVRLPFAAGKCLPGFLYYCPETILTPKSGNAERIEEYTVSVDRGGKLSGAMHELGVDIAHIEAIDFPNGDLQVFDVNPFPSSSGRTLTPLSAAIAQRITQVFDL